MLSRDDDLRLTSQIILSKPTDSQYPPIFKLNPDVQWRR